MKLFDRLSRAVREELRRVAAGRKVYVPRRSREELQIRDAQIRAEHIQHLRAGLSTRQSVRLIGVVHHLSRRQVFETLRKKVRSSAQ